MAFKKTKAEFEITADNRSRKAFKEVRGDLKQTAKAAGTAIKVMAGVAAAVTAVSIKMATDFDKSITEVGALLDSVTQGEMAAMKKRVQAIGIEFGQMRAASTKALFDITSAGFKGAQGMKVLEASAKLAVAGVTGVSNTADLITSALNAYKLEADAAGRVSDIFFATQRAGKTTIQELAASIGDVLPTAKLMGVRLEEVGAALATLTLSGTGLPKAVTQLNAFFLALLKPTEEMKTLGINALDAKGRMLPLLEVVKQFEGIDPKVLAKLVPNVEAFRGLATLTGDFKTLEENLSAVTESAGATNKAFLLLSDAGAARIDRVSESLNVLLERIGDVLSESDEFKLLTTQFEKLFKDMADSISDNQKELTSWVNFIGGEFRRSVRIGVDTVKVFGVAFDLLTAIVAKASQLVLLSAKGWAFLFDALGITEGGVEKMSKALEEAGDIASGAYLEAVETLKNLKVQTSKATEETKKQAKIQKDFNTELKTTKKLTEDLGEIQILGSLKSTAVSDKDLKAREKVLESIRKPLKKFREDQANLFAAVPDAFGAVDLTTTLDAEGFEKVIKQTDKLGTVVNNLAFAEKNLALAKAAGFKAENQQPDISSAEREAVNRAEQDAIHIHKLLQGPLAEVARLENILDDQLRVGTISVLEHKVAVNALHEEFGILQDTVDPVLEALERITSGLETGMTAALVDGIRGMDNFADGARRMVDLVLGEIIRLQVVRPFLQSLFGPSGSGGGLFGAILGSIGSLFTGGTSTAVTALAAKEIAPSLLPAVLPGREHGGRVQKGLPYIVGEKRPEIFFPDQSGTIAPKVGGRMIVQTPQQQRGGNITNINIDLRGSNGSKELQQTVERALRRAGPQFVSASVKAVRDGRSRDPQFFG